MKSRSVILHFLVIVSMGFLFACSAPQYVAAPVGTVPIRNKLESDVFGSYITIETKDSLRFSGELIGIRNDTVVILSDTIQIINRKQIAQARVIVHMPNNYKSAGLVLMGLSSLVVVHAGEYGSGPIVAAIGGILYNGIGLASAQGTEDKKVNYYDWSEGWEKVIVYSRFPHGIPSTIKLLELKAR